MSVTRYGVTRYGGVTFSVTRYGLRYGVSVTRYGFSVTVSVTLVVTITLKSIAQASGRIRSTQDTAGTGTAAGTDHRAKSAS